MRKIGLDLGSKTLGVASTDFAGEVAIGITTLTYNSKDLNALAFSLRKYLDTNGYEFDTIVIGYPTFVKSGDLTQTALLVDQFIPLIQKLYPRVKIVKQDEQFSTMDASEQLMEMGYKASQRKKIIDAKAAEIILSRWLAKQ